MAAHSKESDTPAPRKVNIEPGSNKPKCKELDIRPGVVCYTRTLGHHPN